MPYETLVKEAQALTETERKEVSDFIAFIISRREPKESKLDKFLSPSVYWDDSRSAKDIADEITNARNTSERFGKNNDIFD